LRSAAALGAVGAALALAPAAHAATAVEVGKTCYAEGDKIAIKGTGFTPNGGVDLSLERGATVLERSAEPLAGDDGTVAGSYGLEDETGWFGASETRFDMTLRLVDRTRQGAGQPADSPDVTATTSFIFSRWNVGVRSVGGRIHPSRPVRLNAVGYTNAIGKRLYAHWMRNGKRVHTRRLGVLRGPCGDARARLSRGFPFRPVRAGSYEVRFAPSRTNTRLSAVAHRAVRVKRRIP
jgi:hypothetical protein